MPGPVRAACRLARRPPADLAMLGAALVLVGAVRLGLRVVSFSRLRALLAYLGRPTRDAAPDFAPRAIWAVERASRLLLPRRPCLTQALALQLLFRRRRLPAVLRIGVAKDEQGALRAHAWLESAGRIVIGGAASAQQYHALPPLS